MPAAGPGERLWVLDVPYGTQVDDAAWHPAVKAHLSVGRALPEHLAPYAPGPYTLGRFIENTLNPDHPAPSPEPTDALEPRRIQFEAADAIAARAAAGNGRCLVPLRRGDALRRRAGDGRRLGIPGRYRGLPLDESRLAHVRGAVRRACLLVHRSV